MKSALKTVSVIYIVVAILSFVLGIFMIVSSSTILIAEKKTTLSNASFIFGIAALVSGLVGLIIGLSGISGAKGNKGPLKVGVIFSWIAVIWIAMDIISAIATGSASGATAYIHFITQLVMPVLFIVCAKGVRKEIAAEAASGPHLS